MSKKTAKTPKEVFSYEVRDIVLGKVRGYPPWPGMIVDPSSVSHVVLKERPTNKKAAFYCVRFFPTGEYSWLVSKDISKLQPHEIESYINEPYKKSGDLLQGYRIALDPTNWEKEIEAGQKALKEDNAEVDELESERDEDDSAKAKSKKRKRPSDVAPSRIKKASNSKRNGAKSRAMIESEDDVDTADAEADERPKSKKASPPPSKKSRRDEQQDEDPEALKVRWWRDKLQKSFLSNKGVPKHDEMPALDSLLTTVENYDKINIQYLSFSKIGKVMRYISMLAPEKVPRDAEFHFRDRAKALVEKWHQILVANKPNGAEPSAPTSNGAGDKAADPAVDASNQQGSEQAAAAEQKADISDAQDAPGSPVPVQGGSDAFVSADVTMSEV